MIRKYVGRWKIEGGRTLAMTSLNLCLLVSEVEGSSLLDRWKLEENRIPQLPTSLLPSSHLFGTNFSC
ncbi:MAG TPA: hypothetical protein VD908_02930 [Cytophagales bacterium]|nr:hypothetical protein [Cytophagales bacterium]